MRSVREAPEPPSARTGIQWTIDEWLLATISRDKPGASNDVCTDGTVVMGKTKGLYKEEFPKGSTVKIASRPSLENFLRTWKLHNKPEPDQLNCAGQSYLVLRCFKKLLPHIPQIIEGL